MLLPFAGQDSSAAIRAALPSNLVQTVRGPVPVYIEPHTKRRLLGTREITVRFRPRTSQASQSRLLSSLGLTLVRTNEFEANQHIVEPGAGVDKDDVLDLANTLSEHEALVEYAAPNFIAEYSKTGRTNDPLLAQQWHLDNVGQLGGLASEDVRAVQAWDICPGGSPNVVIAIVDDGVDLDHPDLKANIWTNPNPAAPDKNGRNFYDDNFDPSPHYFHQPYDQMEGNDIHGTACAGIAAAVSNTLGGVGLAYQCKILPVKIFGDDGLASNDRVADGIRYAGQYAQIISCSWFSPDANPDLELAIRDVTKSGRAGKGCLVFCSTGNAGVQFLPPPAGYKEAFAVGASNYLGVRAGYSNYGKGIAFVAPSSDTNDGKKGIMTTDVSQPNRGLNLAGDYTDSFGGTSAATPLAAAVAALVLSVKPQLTRTKVRSILRKTADRIDPGGGAYKKGYSIYYGYGRLNAHAAVVAARDMG
ncbi:MAG TPA: S8 family serine peptidase, partial [Gemmatimonadales bacterium]|nr:S8 family serine peptidase [Gemmatimonadales bacterium]